jgi:uncharacterized protein YkwD
MKRFLLTVFFTLLPSSMVAGELDSITIESVIRAMNEERHAQGLQPLAVDPRLAAAAEDRMRHMEEQAFWAHESPDGMTPFVWVKMRAYDFGRVGENLASGFETATVLMESWMESPGHRANIMSADYEDCGIAIIEGSTTGPARGKSIVVLFGKKRDTVQTVARASRGE